MLRKSPSRVQYRQINMSEIFWNFLRHHMQEHSNHMKINRTGQVYPLIPLPLV